MMENAHELLKALEEEMESKKELELLLQQKETQLKKAMAELERLRHNPASPAVELANETSRPSPQPGISTGNKQAARAKEAFLASLSQAIRTSANAIMDMAARLQETKLGEEQSRYLDAIRRSGEGLLGVTHDILNFGKIEFGSGSEPGFDLGSDPGEPSLGKPVTVPHRREDLLHGKRVLLVEDNHFNLRMASEILKRWGLEFDTAMNGVEAVAQAKANRYDLILMDIQMPQMDGIAATRIIRDDLGLDVPIIALTANINPGDLQKYLSAGMSDCLSKPILPEELWAKFSIHIGGCAESTGNLPPGTVARGKHYDLSGLERISNGSQEFIDRMIRLFLDEAPQILQEIQQAQNGRELHRLKEIAHRISPMVQSLGIEAIRDSVVELKRIRLEKASWIDWEPRITQILNTIELVWAELKTMPPTLDDAPRG